MGMAPSAWKNGGDGVAIHWTVVQSSLGPMLIAATEKGLCRISFDEDESGLRRRFPKADIRAGDASLATLAARVVTLAHQPGRTRSEEHTSELQSLMRISYAVFCLKK